MQQTIDKDGKQFQELFQGESDKDVIDQMDERLAQLELEGHSLDKRVKLTHNEVLDFKKKTQFKMSKIAVKRMKQAKRQASKRKNRNSGK